MKKAGIVFGIYFVWLGVCVAQIQLPPANDNLSNSVVLAGTDLTFSGSLGGATIEDQAEAHAYSIGSGTATASIWWKWTAPADANLTLEVLSSSIVQTRGGTPADALVIYEATNNAVSPADLVNPQMAFRMIFMSLSPVTLSVPVKAGTNYYIQLIGVTAARYAMRLSASNTPVILQQPRSLTVSSNDCALLYVLCAPVPNPSLSFQWLSNGLPVAGQTAPMLALTNVNSSMGGPYSVIVSNQAGYTVSEPATLTVSLSNAPVSLSAIGMQSNSFEFSLTGENGRNYRIESSANFTGWSPAQNFAIDPNWPDSTSIVFNSNSPTLLSVTNSPSAAFFRASPYVLADPDTAVCVNHLEQIRIAKLLWQMDLIEVDVVDPNVAVTYPSFPTPTTSQLFPYLPGRVGLICPDDPYQSTETSYGYGSLSQEPSCAVVPTSHILKTPR